MRLDFLSVLGKERLRDSTLSLSSNNLCKSSMSLISFDLDLSSQREIESKPARTLASSNKILGIEPSVRSWTALERHVGS